MTGIEIISLIVTIVCLLSFSVVFTILFKNYYAHLIKDIKEGKEDINLIENAIEDEKKKNKKTTKAFTIAGKVFGWSLLGVIIVGFSFALYSRFTSNNMVLGDSSYIVIASGSMAEKNPKNTYLETYDLDNQIQTYDIIEIKRYANQNDVKLYDVVAFKNKNNVTIVHRIVEIKPDGTYLTRGDSNEISDMNNQYNGYLKYEDIIGKYTDNNIPLLGIFVVFLQSNSGIITVVSIVYCMLMFDYFKNKYENSIYERTKLLINLTNYDLNKDNVDDLNITFNETLYYNGCKYYFNNNEFVSKENITSNDSGDKTDENVTKTAKIKTKVLKIAKIKSDKDEK